jgi:hypothetical protein
MNQNSACQRRSGGTSLSTGASFALSSAYRLSYFRGQATAALLFSFNHAASDQISLNSLLHEVDYTQENGITRQLTLRPRVRTHHGTDRS